MIEWKGPSYSDHDDRNPQLAGYATRAADATEVCPRSLTLPHAERCSFDMRLLISSDWS
jgi:hypothetical protein